MANDVAQLSQLNEKLEGPRLKKMDLDTILVEEIGEFGWFQARLLALLALMVIFSGWAAGEFIFTTARINTRCLIPECESSSVQDFRSIWIFNAVPSNGRVFDQCSRFANTSMSISENCPRELFDNTTVVPCESFVYENTNTVVYDYELACDEWLRSLIGSIRTFGALLALPITGYISDHWGRRMALCISAFNTAWLGIVRYWADSYISFTISVVAEAVFGSAGFSCAYILVMELVGPKLRIVVGATLNTFFSFSQVTLGFLAWAVPNWRNLTLTLYVPQLITIFYIFFITESVRWYMSKGRYDESSAVLKKVARVNGKLLSDESLELLKYNVIAEKRKNNLVGEDKTIEQWLIVLVLRNKTILTRALISPLWWITATFIYYGLSINSVNMSGDQYFNFASVWTVGIPGHWAAVFLMAIIGRKPVLIGGFWVCAVCQIAYIFLPNGNNALTLTVYLIGKFNIAMVMTTLYIYTAELYPTKHRHRLFAYSSMIGRIGAILAPFTPALSKTLWESLPFALFGGIAFISGILVTLTPETLGTKLPDTMEEAAALGEKNEVDT